MPYDGGEAELYQIFLAPLCTTTTKGEVSSQPVIQLIIISRGMGTTIASKVGKGAQSAFNNGLRSALKGCEKGR
jgi:hypothetical protein